MCEWRRGLPEMLRSCVTLPLAALLLATGATGFFFPTAASRRTPVSSAFRASEVRCSVQTWSEFNCGTWVGYAVAVDPVTAEPQVPYKRTRITTAKPTDGTVQLTTVVLPADGDDAPEEKAVETVNLLDCGIDIDIDGMRTAAAPWQLARCTAPLAFRDALSYHSRSVPPAGTYSAQHAGMQQAQLLSGSSCDKCQVIEHSIAVSDDSRRRCLLQYTESGLLERALLLVETRDGCEPPEAIAPWCALPLVPWPSTRRGHFPGRFTHGVGRPAAPPPPRPRLEHPSHFVRPPSPRPHSSCPHRAPHHARLTTPGCRSTLMALLGDWRGDASVRRHTKGDAAASSAGKGFGAARGFGGRGKQSAITAPSSINVFKQRLTYR